MFPIEKNFATTIANAGKDTVSTVRMVWSSLAGIVTGKFGFNQLSGPVGVAGAISQAASVDWKPAFDSAEQYFEYYDDYHRKSWCCKLIAIAGIGWRTFDFLNY